MKQQSPTTGLVRPWCESDSTTPTGNASRRSSGRKAGGPGIRTAPTGPIGPSKPRRRTKAANKATTRVAPPPEKAASLEVRIDRLAITYRKTHPGVSLEDARREVIRQNPEIRKAMIAEVNPRERPLMRDRPGRGWIATYNKLIGEHTAKGRGIEQARGLVKRDNPLAARRYLAALTFDKMDAKAWREQFRDVLT